MNLPTTRRRFLTTAGSALAAAPAFRVTAKEKPLFRFGLMADCQYADADTRGTRFYRESPRKLEEVVAELNQFELAFTFHLGDFIDKDFKSFDVLEPIAAKLRSQLHHALGNHDFDVADEWKSEVPGRLGLKKGHYSFRRETFRFIVIDTTDVAVYRHPAGTEEQKAAAEELEKREAEGTASAKPWNGRPGDAQIAWLEKELTSAATEKETALVFGHHPILPAETHTMWNGPEMNRLLRKHPCAKLYINGHNHSGHYVNAEGFHYLTLAGMLETRGTNAHARADLFPDRLEITGFGRQESRVLKFR